MKTRLQRTRECNKPVVDDLHFYIIIIIIILYLISRGSVCMIFFIYFLVLLICFPTEYYGGSEVTCRKPDTFLLAATFAASFTASLNLLRLLLRV